MHHLEERDRRENVVRRRDDGGDAEAPLEAERQVDQRDEERDEDRRERLGLQLAADARADRLGATPPAPSFAGSALLESTPTICVADAVGIGRSRRALPWAAP